MIGSPFEYGVQSLASEQIGTGVKHVYLRGWRLVLSSGLSNPGERGSRFVGNGVAGEGLRELFQQSDQMWCRLERWLRVGGVSGGRVGWGLRRKVGSHWDHRFDFEAVPKEGTDQCHVLQHQGPSNALEKGE